MPHNQQNPKKTFSGAQMVNVRELGNPRPLFQGSNLSDLARGFKLEAEKAVQSMSADALLNTPTDDLVTALIEKYSFTTPTLRRGEAYLEDPIDIEIHMNDYGYQVRQPGTLLALVIPFDGEGGMFYMRSTIFGGSPIGNLHYNELVLTIRGVSLQSDAVDRQFGSMLDQIEQYLASQRSVAEQHRTTLPPHLRQFIEGRKQKLLADRNLVSGLAFPIKARSNAPKTYVVPVMRKQVQILRSTETTAPFKPEPVLDEGTYKSILDIVHSMTLVMERSPSAFAKMREEHVRQHYLVQLNGQFDGQATGETFNYEGKTDILIRHENRNLFVAECKFWTGEKNFIQTIDQILNYVTWRDTKTAIILFNRKTGFSDVLEKAKATTAAHPHYKRGPTVVGETWFRYTFGNPTDHNREVILTVMAFNVPA